jgi:threonine/homoserine/homoserine lactone efflux protein
MELMLAFFAAAGAFASVPGPGMLYISGQTIAHGHRTGLVASVGAHLGGYAHVGAAAAGLAVLLTAVPALYAAMKLAGAAYLVWLGVRLIRQRPERETALPRTGGRTPWRAFRDSLVVEVLNPKTALFFVAFLPQFTDPAAAWPLWAQFLALGAITNAMFSCGDLACIALAGTLRAKLAASHLGQRIARWIGGTVLVGLGVKLAASRQG